MEVFEAIGAHASGKITDEELKEIEEAASPGFGACGGQFTANTMAMAFEMLGISPMRESGVPAQYDAKEDVAYRTGQLIMDVLARGQRPSDIITRESLENAIAAVAMSGGSTNGVLHLLAVANEAGIELDIDDFDRISSKTPLTCDLSPGGRYLATHLHEAGGVPVVASRLLEAGLLHEGAQTVTGKTIGELARAAAGDGGPAGRAPAVGPAQADRRPRDPARQPRPRGLRGQARRPRARAPQRPRARVRRRGGRDARRHHRPDRRGRRDRHPQRGPRRRPRDARDARRHRRARRRRPRRQRRADHRRALLRRHARLHGRPRRARGRPRRPDRRRAGGRHGDDRRRERAGSTST